MSAVNRPSLVKITVNLAPTTDAALTQMATGQGISRTDALNRAIRVAALLHELAPNDYFKIVLADGSERDIYLV